MANQEKSAAELYREERKERIAKAAKRNSKKHVSEKTQKTVVSIIAVILVVAIVGAITGGIVNNKGVFERNKIITTIGDTEIDKYEYAYYYSSTLQQYASQAAQFDMYYGAGMGAMYTGYDYSKLPAEQSYMGEIEGVENPTFADYFSHQAMESLKYVKACVAYAAENNITLDEADYKTIDETYAQIEENCVNEDGSKYSVGAYLRLSYGKGMTEKLFRNIMEEQALAQKVMEVKQDEFKASYTDKEVEAEYKKNIDEYGKVTVRSYAFSAEVADEEKGATAEEKAAAKSKAETFASKITDEESFKALASEYAELAKEENYKDFLTNDSLTLAKDDAVSNYSDDENLLKWAKTAKKGATYVSGSEDTYTVYFMVDPLHKAADEKTYDVRHILVKFPEEEAEEVVEETTESAEDTTEAAEAETTEAAKEEKKETEKVEPKEFDASKYDATIVNNIKDPVTDAEAYNKTIDILTSYLEGDKTEDAFAELAVKHSEDPGSAEKGGLYEAVPLGDMVAEFEGWALDESRKAGDVGIVETSYGYHIMYFIKTNVTTWADTIKTDLASAEYNTFTDELVKADNVKAGELDAAMSDDIDVYMETIAKNLASQYSSYMSSMSYQ